MCRCRRRHRRSGSRRDLIAAVDIITTVSADEQVVASPADEMISAAHDTIDNSSVTGEDRVVPVAAKDHRRAAVTRPVPFFLNSTTSSFPSLGVDRN